jgi:hypothetical protein
MKATFEHELVMRMIEEAVKAEREACALVADGAIDFWVKAGYLEGPHIEEAHNIAQEIRARGEYD